MNKKELILIGGGEHARVVMEAAALEGWRVSGFVDPQPCPETTARTGVPRLGTDQDLPELLTAHPDAALIFGIGHQPELRQKIVKQLRPLTPCWGIVRHPSALISPQAKIGDGAVILARAVINTGARIGRHTIINTGALVEHDVEVGDFTLLAPGVLTGGGVRIGPGCLIGIGARIRDHLEIGARCIVGTGSVVVSAIPPDMKVAGIPAVSLDHCQRDINLDTVCIPPDTTIVDAMTAISRSGLAIALVAGPDRRLLGTLTDGDIRKAILAGHAYEETVHHFMNPNFIASVEDLPRATAIDMMKAHGIAHLPILDSHGRLIRLHLMNQLIGSAPLPISAVIMAGGQGRRLRPITENLPKPMVRVAGRPILEHIVLHLAGMNIREIYLAVHYLGEQIEQHFGDGRDFGCTIRYLHETTPLGTGGALSLLPSDWPENQYILVMNGDLITQVDVERMYEAHQRGDYALTIGVRYHDVAIPYGVVETDAAHRVLAIQEKPINRYLINGGVYLLSPQILPLIPQDAPFPITDLVTRCLAENHPVGVHPLEGDWEDIGQPEQLTRARGLD